MRFKTLLGLAAIGGAVAYAQKRRGGDMSFAGFKNTFHDLIGQAQNKLGSLGLNIGGQNAGVGRSHMGERDVNVGLSDTANVGGVGGTSQSGSRVGGGSMGYGEDYGSGGGLGGGYNSPNGIGGGGNRR